MSVFVYPDWIVIVHELLALLLGWSCFCRATRMSGRSTRRDVRLAFWALAIAAVVAMFAPAIWDWRPEPVSLVLLIGITVVQSVTSRHWVAGVPHGFTSHGAANSVPPGGQT